MVDDPNQARIAGLLAALADLFAAADLDGVEPDAVVAILVPKLQRRQNAGPGFLHISRLVTSLLLPNMPAHHRPVDPLQ
jgi:hypothetical protein